MKPGDAVTRMIEEKPSGQVIPRGSPSGAPKVKREPHCKRCGTSVAEGVEFCEVCEEIVAQQKPPQATVIIIREVEKKPNPEVQDAE